MFRVKLRPGTVILIDFVIIVRVCLFFKLAISLHLRHRASIQRSSPSAHLISP